MSYWSLGSGYRIKGVDLAFPNVLSSIKNPIKNIILQFDIEYMQRKIKADMMWGLFLQFLKKIKANNIFIRFGHHTFILIRLSLFPTYLLINWSRILVSHDPFFG